MKSFGNKNQSGYIAIVTAIILAALIMMIAVALSLLSFSSRLNNLDFYDKKASYFTARSCLEKTLLELSKDSNYGGNATTTVAGHQCFTFPIETAANNKIIKSKSVVGGAVTNLRLTIDAITLSTLSLEEISRF